MLQGGEARSRPSTSICDRRAVAVVAVLCPCVLDAGDVVELALDSSSRCPGL